MAVVHEEDVRRMLRHAEGRDFEALRDTAIIIMLTTRAVVSQRSPT